MPGAERTWLGNPRKAQVKFAIAFLISKDRKQPNNRSLAAQSMLEEDRNLPPN